MRRDAFDEAELESLKGRSWRVAHVGKRNVTWL
jgi:hypothetical protein